MTDEPEASERGRYAVLAHEDGSVAIRRSTPLCEACATCGCGDPQVQLEIPASAVPVLQAYAEGGVPAVMGMMSKNGGFMKLPGMLKEARRK